MYEENSITGRLNQLYQESKLTREEFAKRCEISTSALTNYLKGSRTPDAAKLPHICEEFKVSADWLLGLSDIRNPSAELKGVVDYTGLSEKVIKRITDNDDLGEYINEINHFIEIPYFRDFIQEYKLFLTMLQRYDIDEENHYEENEDGKIVLSKCASVRFIMRSLERFLADITNEDYYAQCDIALKNTQMQKMQRFEDILIAAEQNPGIKELESYKKVMELLDKHKKE